MKIAIKSGFWDDPTVWENVTNQSTISTATNINVTTTGIFSVPWTPGSGVTISGLMVFPNSNWAGRNITFTLQANNVDTAMSVTINGSDVALNQPLYCRLPLNYPAAAGVALRWKAQTSTGSCAIAQSSTASQFAAATTEFVGGVPANEFTVIPTNNGVNNISVNVRNTSAQAGNNSAASGSGAFATSPRWWDMGLQISGGAVGVAELIFSAGVNTALEMKNSAWAFTNGKVTQKPSSGFTSIVNWTPGATIGTSTLYWNWGAGSICDIQGVGLATPANWKTKFTSGLGTSASPAILVNGSDVAIGDYLVFHPTGNGATNFNETEYRYVISKPSTNQVVLSSTSGGSENALLYTHTGGYVFNTMAGKNVIYKSTDTRTWHMLFASTTGNSTNQILRWARLQDLYSSASAARGGLCPASGSPLFEYLALGTPGVGLISQQMYIPSTNLNSMTMTGILCFGASSASAGDGTIGALGVNKTYNDCWVVDCNTRGWNVAGSNPIFNKSGAIACGKGVVVGLYSGWAIGGVNAAQMNDCEAHSCRYAGMLLYPGGADNVAVRYISGTLGLNGTDAVTQGSGQPGYNTFYFDSPTIAEANLMTNHTLMLAGSKITFNDVNGTNYNSYVYATDGVEQYTGSGLVDTTTSPLGFRTQRIAPVNTTGFKYRYKQLANPSQIFTTYGRLWVNSAALADAGFTVTVDLYLPGTVEGVDAPSASVTMTKTTNSSSANAQFLLSANYAGTRPLFANIVVTVKNTNNVASAYAFIGDILNGTNNITNQSTEERGAPSPIMFEQNGDSNAVAIAVDNYMGAKIGGYVWNDTSTYPTNSKGGLLTKAKSLASFIRNTM